MRRSERAYCCRCDRVQETTILDGVVSCYCCGRKVEPRKDTPLQGTPAVWYTPTE